MTKLWKPSRRLFLAGGAGLIAAPAIVRAGSMSLLGAGKTGAGGVTPFDIDGTPVFFSANNPSTATVLPAFSTTFGNNINLVAMVVNGGPVVSITDTAGNTYAALSGADGVAMTVWAAKCASPQLNNVVTITTTAVGFISASLSSFSGAKFSAPYDPNMPNGIGSAGAVSITTTNANDILYGVTNPGTGTASAASPWTTIYNGSGAFLAVEYQKVSATQSGTALNFTDNTTNGQRAVALVQGP